MEETFRDMEPYRPEAPSGTAFLYQSGNTILLAEILANVQEKSITQYVSIISGDPHTQRIMQSGV